MLFAVLPTVELGEQVVHVIGHALEAEVPDHSAHHEDNRDDEHGCTGLVHLCSCHHTQVTVARRSPTPSTIETLETVTAGAPPTLTDLNSLEPPQRPPIA